jgi:hypothetical protein
LLDTHYLSNRVNSAIGAPGECCLNRFTGEAFERSFEFLLYWSVPS